jgi:hypothetical protein
MSNVWFTIRGQTPVKGTGALHVEYLQDNYERLFLDALS